MCTIFEKQSSTLKTTILPSELGNTVTNARDMESVSSGNGQRSKESSWSVLWDLGLGTGGTGDNELPEGAGTNSQLTGQVEGGRHCLWEQITTCSISRPFSGEQSGT